MPISKKKKKADEKFGEYSVKRHAFQEECMPALEKYGVENMRWSLTGQIYDEVVRPLLTKKAKK